MGEGGGNVLGNQLLGMTGKCVEDLFLGLGSFLVQKFSGGHFRMERY